MSNIEPQALSALRKALDVADLKEAASFALAVIDMLENAKTHPVENQEELSVIAGNLTETILKAMESESDSKSRVTATI